VKEDASFARREVTSRETALSLEAEAAEVIDLAEMKEKGDSPTEMAATVAIKIIVVVTELSLLDERKEGNATPVVARHHVALWNVGNGLLPVHHPVVITNHLAHGPLPGATPARLAAALPTPE